MVTPKLAAVAIAALSLAGCTETVEPPATHLAAAGDPPTAPEKAPASQWVNAGDRHWRSDLGGEQIAPPAPVDGTLRLGSELYQLKPGDPSNAEVCSAGAWFTDPSRRPALLVAGHCKVAADGPVSVSPQVGSPFKDLTPVGHYNDRDSHGKLYDADLAVLELNPGVSPAPGSALVGGRWPAIGVLTAATAESLAPHTSVCVVGAPIGTHCGELLGAIDRAAMVEFPTLYGDPHGNSGGSAWLIDDAGNAVLLGSITEGGSDSGGTIFDIDLADPVIRDRGLTIVTG